MSRHSRRGLFRLGLSFAVLCAAAPAVADPVFYGVTGSTLVRFDMGAQTATLVAPLQTGGLPVNVMEDCDFDAGGTLWAMRQGNIGGFPPTIVSRAYTVDITNGNAVPQGDFGANATQQSLAFRALFNLGAYQALYCGGSIANVDVDCSAAVDFFDIDPLLACLFSVCPPCP